MDAARHMRHASLVAEREYAEINPEVLKWARERAGYSVEEVGKKIGASTERVKQWEGGKAQLTMGRLDALASIYKRPTAIFYLPKPPMEPEATPPDFRANATGTTSPELRFQLRRAHERRDVALDLFAETKQEPKVFEFKALATEDPIVVGGRLRHVLGIDVETQRSWKTDRTGYKALGAWKDATERAGVLVFQASRRDLAGSRGLSIWASPLPVVVLASSDTATGRVFTLMHELAHLGLREGGICDLNDHGVESFCNQVAAAALMPERTIRAEVAALPRGRTGWTNAAIEDLARVFSVSVQALVLRLLELGEVSQEFYRSRRAEFDKRNAAAGGERGHAIPQQTLAIARNGRHFTRLVLEAYHRGAITAHDASTHLNVAFKYVPEIEREMARHEWRAAS
jgi:Zn-dependent peptidase ImmA (M78 family)/transcriptional regulator with XRE-family HTH domain